GPDVREAQRLPLAEHNAQHAVLARQRADRLAPPLRDAVDHELGERPTVVGHAQRRIPGTGQGADRAHDHLEHVTDRQLPGNRQHRRTDPAEYLVLASGPVRARKGRTRGGARGRGTSSRSGNAAFLAHTLTYRRGPPAGSGTGPTTNVAGLPARTADAAPRA